MNKTLTVIAMLFFSSTASNLISYIPFSNPAAMEWYNDFVSKYQIPKINQVKKIKIAIIDSGYSSPFNTENFIYNENGFNESHGTHITGIIYAINPNAEIFSYNVYNPDNTSETIQKTAEAIRKAIKENVDLINISMGGGSQSLEELQAIDEAQKAGILIITAAGNHNSEISTIQCDEYPACYKKYFNNIIVVGNLMNRFMKNPSSNFGDMVDLSFNGSVVESLDPKEGFAYQTGTSQAAAFITGFLSLSLSEHFKALTIEEKKEILMKYTGKRQKEIGFMKVHSHLNRSLASFN